MTRLWIGVGLLLSLLAIGLGLWWFLSPLHEELASELDRAAALALDGDMAQAQAVARQARQRWQQNRNFIAAFTDHSPMEEMEALFAELENLQSDQTRDFAAICAHLAQSARAISESHALKWWGLL